MHVPSQMHSLRGRGPDSKATHRRLFPSTAHVLNQSCGGCCRAQYISCLDERIPVTVAPAPCTTAATMLTRSVVAVVCGALAVAALPGSVEFERTVADLYEPEYGFQETFEEPQWYDDAIDEFVSVDVEDPPRHPPVPHFPHHGDHGHHGPDVANKTIYQALKEDTRYAGLHERARIVC